MKIKIINPNTTAQMTAAIGEAARAAAGEGTRIEAVNPAGGPPSIECHYDSAAAAMGVLEVLRADADSADAYIIACFGDPGLAAAREASARPVLGIAQAAFHAAGMIGGNFSVVTTIARTAPICERLLREYGFATRCRKVRAVDIKVLDLESPIAREQIAAECRRAIAADRCDAIVLGCAGMADLAASLSEDLQTPTLDGVACAVKFAEALCALNLRPAKAGEYAYPLPKQYAGPLAPLSPRQKGA